MKYFDSHCHLGDDAFKEDFDAVYQRALEKEVTRMLVLGWDLPSSRNAVALAKKYKNIYAAVGFHPENLDEVSFEALEQIKELAKEEKVVAIGEIGLDYHWFKDPEPRVKQREWFIKQIELANSLSLPISVHARDASGDTLQILTDHPAKYGAVLHCYSGSVETMKSLSKLGYYFGFDGPITYKNAVEPKECVKACPINRILTETDSPYLSPVPLRGTRNEPGNIPLIVEKMAELKEISVEEMAEQLNRNFEELFHVKAL